MLDSDQYSIIIPTYNERENLPLIVSLIDEVCAQHGIDYEVVVVDDASPDATAKVATSLQVVYPKRIKLVKRNAKLGLGSAYAAGLQVASGGWVFLMDADLSHHPKYLPCFIRKQQETGADIVTGSRYIEGGGVAGWSFKRKLTSRGANLLASHLLASRVSDLTGAYRLYRREILTSLLTSVTSKGYAFQMEFIVRAERRGYHIEEVPIIFVDRLYGTSKLGPSEFVLWLKGLLYLICTTG